MERDFNFEWKFTHLPLGTDQSLTLDDRQWRDIRLPHDWSIEAPYSQENTAGATARHLGMHRIRRRVRIHK